MYILTIVLLFSQVTIVSTHASKEVCEQIAQHVLLMSVGEQAVKSASCSAAPAVDSGASRGP